MMVRGDKKGRSFSVKLTLLIFHTLFLTLFCGCGFIEDAKELLFPEEEAEASFSMEGEENDATPIIVINSENIKVDFSADITPTPTPTPFVYEEIYDDVNKIYSKEAKDPDEAVLTFIGDISFAEGYSNMSALYAEPDRI